MKAMRVVLPFWLFRVMFEMACIEWSCADRGPRLGIEIEVEIEKESGRSRRKVSMRKNEDV